MARFGVGTLIAACALVLVMDFPWGDLQDHPHWENIRRVPFVSPPIRATDMVLNALLGAPIGVGAALVFGRAVISAALIAGLVSAAGEWMQFYSHSRFPSTTDLAMNVLGAVAAAGVVAAWKRHRVEPSGR